MVAACLDANGPSTAGIRFTYANVAYLASDESRFLNATELIIDGGQTASTTGKVWED